MALPAWLRGLTTRFRGAHPEHSAIATAMLKVVLFVLLGSGARLAKEMAIAHRYGVSADVDTYLFMFSLVAWPVGVWLGVLTVVLLPLVARLRHHDADDLSQFRSELLGFTIAIGAVLMVLFLFGFPWILRVSFVGLSTSSFEQIVEHVPSMAALLPLGCVVSVLSAWTLSCGRHLGTLLEALPSLTIFLVLVVVTPSGIEPLILGTLAGFAIHVAALATHLAARGELSLPRWSLHSLHWGFFWRSFGLMLAGQALMSFTSLVDQFFAAALPSGSISVLGYANRVLGLILGLGGLAVSRATLPVFSTAHARGGIQVAHVARLWSIILFSMGLVVCLLAWLLAPDLVCLLFERGAFRADDSAAVAQVLRVQLLQLPFYFAGLVFASYLSSRGEYHWLLWSGIIGLAVKVAGNAAWSSSYGLSGIASASVLMYVTNLTFFVFVFRHIANSK